MKTTTRTSTATITKHGLEGVLRALEKVNKRARKLGLPEATVTVDAERLERRPDEQARAAGILDTVLVTMLDITITGETPVIDGYDVAAVIDHDQTGNVVHQVNGYTISDRIKDAPAFCEHCFTRRRRKTTIILAKTDGQRLVRVGKQCLKDFTGCDNPHAITGYVSALLGFIDDCDDERERGMSAGPGEVDVKRIVRAGVRYAWAFGERYDKDEMKLFSVDGSLNDFGRSRSGGSLEPDWHRECRERLCAGHTREIDAACAEEAQRIIEWVAAFDVEANGAQNMAEYWRNLKIATGHPYQPAKRANLIASAVACYRGKLAYLRKQADKAEAAAAAPESNFTGEIGVRVKKVEAEIIGTRRYSTPYTFSYEDDGEREVVTFRDADGNLIVWFTNPTALEKGQRGLLSYTPKKHEEHKGVKQTIASRCRFDATDDDAQNAQGA